MAEQNPFAFLDFSEEEALEVVNEVSKNPHHRDGGICLCGHPRSKHIEGPLGYTCAPAKQFCPCKKMRIVVESSDTRFFLCKTLGGGARHALSQGMIKATQKGASVVWIETSNCDKCGEEKPVSPIPVSQRGNEMQEATGYDVLMCRECRLGVGNDIGE
jgi:hypothetical protein